MNDSKPNFNPADRAADLPDEQLDRLLRTTMAARPEPVAPHNLAHRAMTMARAQASERAARHQLHLARQRRWMQFSGIAATILITALLAGAAYRLWARGDITAIAAATASDSSPSIATSTDADSDASTTSSSTTSMTSTVTVVVVAELLVLAMVLISMSRSGPTTPWGAEAAGGFW